MIFVGTTNPGKIREFAGILRPLNLEFEPVAFDVVESGATFEENARIKALEYYQKVGTPEDIVLCEDSGLVVSALNGLPGPYSARFSDVELSDSLDVLSHQKSDRPRKEIDRSNNQRLLSLMEGIPHDLRGAYFEVVIAVCECGDITYTCSAKAHGWISTEPRGTKGFGYDPVFVGQDTYRKTYAEIDQARKNARSHRRKCLKTLSSWLATEYMGKS